MQHAAGSAAIVTPADTHTKHTQTHALTSVEGQVAQPVVRLVVAEQLVLLLVRQRVCWVALIRHQQQVVVTQLLLLLQVVRAGHATHGAQVQRAPEHVTASPSGRVACCMHACTGSECE
jgi:hypothetical protein